MNNHVSNKSGVHFGFAGASWIHKHSLAGHQELCTGNNTHVRATEECIDFQDVKTAQMGMDSGR